MNNLKNLTAADLFAISRALWVEEDNLYARASKFPPGSPDGDGTSPSEVAWARLDENRALQQTVRQCRDEAEAWEGYMRARERG